MTMPIQSPPGLVVPPLQHFVSSNKKGRGRGTLVFAPYAKVEARTLADPGGAYYPAVVENRTKAGMYVVKFDEYWGVLETVPAKDVRARANRDTCQTMAVDPIQALSKCELRDAEGNRILPPMDDTDLNTLD